MNDNEIYNIYKDYKVNNIVFYNEKSGQVQIQFPAIAYAEHKAINIPEIMIIEFNINENNVIILRKWLPEFVLKGVVSRIREMYNEGNQYLWGV